MSDGRAHAKLNLALVVGPRRPDGKHEITTVYQRIALADRISVEPSDELQVSGFDADTLVHSALQALADASGEPPRWRAVIEKAIPVASGLAGGSSDAATALALANRQLARPLPADDLRLLAGRLGADVPFFLAAGPQLGEGDGTELRPVLLPQEYAVLLVLPAGAVKASTASVYAEFDARGGEIGFPERRGRLLAALERTADAADLAELPPNDLARSPAANRLRALGAFRADVSGAGPIVYGLFLEQASAEAAAEAMREAADRVWISAPAW